MNRTHRRTTAPALALLGALLLGAPAVAAPAAPAIAAPAAPAVAAPAIAAPAAPAVAAPAVAAPAAPAVAAPAVDTRAQGLRAADAPKLSRAEEIRRAKVWLTANHGKPVPYSQKETWSDGYRQDCSGYASMALRLPKSGPNTVALKNDGWTKAIKMSELRQGDLVIKANSSDPDHRHVVIFDSWDNGKHTSYHAYEQAGGVGTRHTSHTYGLKDGDNYRAYRPVNLTD